MSNSPVEPTSSSSPQSVAMQSTLTSRTGGSRVGSPACPNPPTVVLLAPTTIAPLVGPISVNPAPLCTESSGLGDPSEGGINESSRWMALPEQMDEALATSVETRAHKIHRVFQMTAAPSAVIIGLLLLDQWLFQAKVEAQTVGRFISLYCTMMSVIMTGLLIYLHMTAYTNPPQQRFIIRILLMVPIYAVDSCLALWDHSVAPAIGLVRDCYESYVIYNFFYLLMSYLGGEEQALASRVGVKVSHMVPLCCLPPFQLSHRTLKLWKLLLVQYMLLKPVLATIAILLTPSGAFDESSWSFSNVHVYFVIILNISVTLAFTSLVYFFMEYKDLLVAHSPIGKFAAVKAVVFLSFWQGVLMGLLVHMGVIKQSREGLWSSDQVSTGLQDFLICIEMLLMCYLHHRVFPETPYVPLMGHQTVKPWVVQHVFSVSDVVDDSVQTVAQVAATVVDDGESGKEV